MKFRNASLTLNGERCFLAKQGELTHLLVRLGDIAEVRFGIKTGANEFFYLPLTSPLIKRGQRRVLKVLNGAGWEGEIEEEFLKPVIKSPRICLFLILLL